MSDLCEIYTDLYRDKNQVCEDSSQCGVAQDVAYVDNTQNIEHCARQQKAPKHYSLEHSLAITGQNVNHLDSRKIWRKVN